MAKSKVETAYVVPKDMRVLEARVEVLLREQTGLGADAALFARIQAAAARHAEVSDELAFLIQVRGDVQSHDWATTVDGINVISVAAPPNSLQTGPLRQMQVVYEERGHTITTTLKSAPREVHAAIERNVSVLPADLQEIGLARILTGYARGYLRG